METVAKDIYVKKQKHGHFAGAVEQANELTIQCWICKAVFSADNEKLSDYCHFPYQYLQPTAQNPELRSTDRTKLVRIWLTSYCNEPSSVQP